VLAIAGTAAARGADAEPAADAHADAANLAQRYVEQAALRERLRAENAFLVEEIERLESARRVRETHQEDARLVRFTHPTGDLTAEVFRSLDDKAAPVVADLRQSAADWRGEAERLQQVWRPLRTAVYEEQLLLYEVQGSRRVAGQLASLLSVDNRWFWLFGVVAVAGLLAVVFHDRRHELRRLLNGGRARAMRLSEALSVAWILLIAVTAAIFLLGDRLYESLMTAGAGGEALPRTAIAAQLEEVERETEELQTRHDDLQRQYDEAEAAYREQLAASLPADSPLPGLWQQSRHQVREMNASLVLLETLPAAIAADRALLERLDDELGATAEATVRLAQLKRWIRGLLGLALLGLAAGGGLLFWRGVQHRRRTTANTCPLCLGTSRLVSVRVGGDDDEGKRAARMLVRCKNVIARQPYEECGYTYSSLYRAMGKFCFPTLGIPQAGKTHWLAMVYWQLNAGHHPKSLEFAKLQSRMAQDFDRIVEEILYARIGTAATQRSHVPHPLVFNFRDRDRWGRSNVLVNIFDYSGEVTSDMSAEDYRRRRALDADGFFFFLDPTFPAAPQIKALETFRDDLRTVKGIKAGHRTRTPVALCLSKIDMLARQPYVATNGGNLAAEFYAELSRIDPSGESLSRQVLRDRSQATARLRKIIWPEWEIERQIDDLFGGRYQFFPLTPVGLDGRGETDLSLRTISPFGLLEPLAWLLQMNGYPVLE
jgi:hypothetical protein